MNVLAVLLASLSHVLPPGDAERAIGVVVLEDELLIDYRYGLGADALLAELMELGVAEVPDDPVAAARLHMESAAESLGERLKVLINEQPVDVQWVESELIYQHHLRASCRYRVDLSSRTGPLQIRVEDRNFAGYPGHVQLAAKPRNRGMEFRSDLPPILLRAERTPIGTGVAFKPPRLTMRVVRADDDSSSGVPSAVDVAEESSTAGENATPAARVTRGRGTRQSGNRQPLDRPPSWTPWILRLALLVALVVAGILATRGV